MCRAFATGIVQYDNSPFRCAAANTNNGMNSKVMDAVYAASILICLPIFGLRVLVLSILGLILSHAALGMKSQA